jgi:protein-S-isoprenylcysteine O-methyltransferase Ste14
MQSGDRHRQRDAIHHEHADIIRCARLGACDAAVYRLSRARFSRRTTAMEVFVGDQFPEGRDGNTSAAAWVFTAMHGSYGLVWILKDLAFPDPNWQRRITIGGGINAFLGVLGWYWVFGWLLISGTSQPDYPLPDFAWFCLCISLCILGCAIMIAADAQKFFTLRVQRGLITDGMHRYVRHPNYLGEIMIYGSFAMMVWHWLPVLVLAWVWLGLFAVNMVMKEASMSRYPDWAAYKKRTWWLVPYVI